MALTKIKLGKLIKQSSLKNADDILTLDAVRGISTQRKFIVTKADMDGVSLKNYKVVNPYFFAYVTDTSRRGDKISLAFNMSNQQCLVSSISIVFYIERTDILDPLYLFMYFNKPEFDRYSRFNSWGSARETFSWEDMCDIDFELPPIEIQRKYVEIYKGMVENQVAYETGLEDLKLVCDGFIEDLRRKNPCEEIGKYIVCTDRKTDNPSLKIQGISNQQKLNDSNSRVEGVKTEKYLRIDSREFGYSPIHINDGSIAFNSSDESFLLSPIYKTFKVMDEKKILPEYLMMWFGRTEFIRYCTFHAFGSARDTFEWAQMCKVKIPIPNIEIQKSIANIYNCYQKRKEINEQLKQQIKNICPILIKGSLEDSSSYGKE